MPSTVRASLLVLLLAHAAASASAAEDDPSFTQRDGFLLSHPGLYWSGIGVRAYQRGRLDEAMTAFRRAARHADKTSQAMISQMLWNGDGVERDRAIAYVWADLAAERGYPQFVATRERFWNALTAEEQRTALAAGPAIFDEYGDAAAKPREERALRAGRRKATGSRLGHVGTLAAWQRLPNGDFERIDGSFLYADRYWKPESYWKWRDEAWSPLPHGTVEVGPIAVPEDTPPAHRDDAGRQ